MGEGKKYADEFLTKVSEITDAVRSGFGGLRELLSKSFLFVRDVYLNKVIPKINGTVASYANTSTTDALKIEFEREIDQLMIYVSTACYMDSSPSMQQPMYVSQGMTLMFPLRTKELYLRAATTAGVVYVWGLF